MAKTFSCEECRTRFTWKPEHSLKPSCPNCGNGDFKLEFGHEKDGLKVEVNKIAKEA